MRSNVWLVVLGALLVNGCSILSTPVGRGYNQNWSWKPGTVYTTGDVRIVTQRKHPVTGQDVVCTEPSPDIAKALSTAVQVSANGGNGTTNVGVNLAGGSAEAVTELAGRTTALLGLRDGLYRACEAYANGAIGANAYALILGRYGQLMSTLFLGQDISGAVGAGGKGSATSPALVSFNGQPSSQNSTSTPSSTKSPTPKPSATEGSDPTPSSTEGSDPKPSSTNGSDPTPSATKDAASTDSSTVQSVGDSTGAAIALTRMNEDYLHLGFSDVINLVLVSCINEFDPTRAIPAGALFPLHPSGDEHNSYLKTLCDDFAKNVDYLVTKYPQWSADYPPVAFVQPASSKPPASSAKSPNPKSSGASLQGAQVLAAQKALSLLAQKDPKDPILDPGKADGKWGPQTAAAVTSFQVKNKLKVTGVLDAETLKALGL